MNKIIAICAAQIYLWEQERQIHAICDCARERGYEVMIYNLSVRWMLRRVIAGVN